MRAFIAIELPDDLKKMISHLRVDIPGARWVPVDQIHLTMAFLGEVDDTAIAMLNVELAGIQLPEFRLSFGGAGCFPDRRRPRILWIGLEPHPQLQLLAEKVRESVSVCDIPLEERPFSPHITLARLKLSPSREFDLFLEQHKKLQLPAFPVREFMLFQSQLTPQGAVHSPIRRFPLGEKR